MYIFISIKVKWSDQVVSQDVFDSFSIFAYPGCLSWIPDRNFFYPGSRSKRSRIRAKKNLIYVTHKSFDNISKIWYKIFIPDPDIFHPGSGSKSQKAPVPKTGSTTLSLQPLLRSGWFASTHPPASVTVAGLIAQSYSTNNSGFLLGCFVVARVLYLTVRY